MANVWFAKEGPEPTSGEEPNRLVELSDCIVHLRLKKHDRLCGLDKTPNKFGEDRPGIVKGPEYVVVEIDENEAQAEGWKSGFYIARMSVQEAKEAIARLDDSK